MAKRIATVTGTALVPGVSRNNRLYTREAIAKAVARGQARIADDTMPLTMLSHHGAEDDSTRIVGRITGLTLAEDGSARFTADIADSEHGRTIAGLVDTRGGKPFLKGVSIRGAWVGTPRSEDRDGKQVETCDDLELDGLDFTKRPGVAGAGVDSFEPVAESFAPGRPAIFESVSEALVSQINEDAVSNRAATAASRYADPGYQADKAKRYALDTKAQSKAAWSYINMPKNSKLYTAAQLKRIKGRIKAALKKFGVEISADEHWVVDRGYLAESAEIVEHYGDEYGRGQGSFCISLSNGPLNISVSSYCVDPADLDLIGRAAMGAACDALAAIDPDADGDMDVPGADSEDTDDDAMESVPVTAPLADGEFVMSAETVASIPAPTTAAEATAHDSAAPDADDAPHAAPDSAADPHTEQEAPAVSEPTIPAVEATPAAAAITFTAEQFQQFLATMRPAPAAPAESAPAAPVVEAAPVAPQAPVVTETEDQRIERLVAEKVAAVKTALIQDFVEEGHGPVRKGLVRPVTETATAGDGDLNEYGVPSDWPNKPLHEYSSAERARYFGPALQDHILKERAVY